MSTVRLSVVITAFITSVVVNMAVILALQYNSFSSFVVYEYITQAQMNINDVLPPKPSMMTNRMFEELIRTGEFNNMITLSWMEWKYREDVKLWDVPNLPIISFATMSGDCDDFARMTTYLLHAHYPNAPVYYITTGPDSGGGHAFAVYFDIFRGQIGMYDLNGRRWLDIDSNQDLIGNIRMLLMSEYSENLHFSVRSWDLEKIVHLGSIKYEES